MNGWIIIATVVSALATVGIFVLAVLTYLLHKSTVDAQANLNSRFENLLEALVVASFVAGGTHGYDRQLAEFRKHYKGDIPILSAEDKV